MPSSSIQLKTLEVARAAVLLAYGGTTIAPDGAGGGHMQINSVSSFVSGSGSLVVSPDSYEAAQAILPKLKRLTSAGPLAVFAAAHRMAVDQVLGTGRARVLFRPAMSSASAFYRCQSPAYALNGRSACQAFVDPTVATKTLVEFDTVSFQIAHDEYTLKVQRALQKAAVKIVYEIDDAWWALHDSHPGHLYYQRPSVQAAVLEAVKSADLVTTTTRTLADAIEARSGRRDVAVVPNCAPIARDPRPEHKPSAGPFKVLWMGSPSHAVDIEPLAALAAWLKKVEGELVVFGMESGIKSARHLPFMPFEEYFETLADLRPQIVVAPLAPIEFNLFKSAIRLYEATWFCAAPVVASAVGPYAQWQNGQDIVHVEREQDWIAAVRYLMDSDSERKRIWEGALARTMREYDADARADELAGPFEGLVATAKTEAPRFL